MKERLKEVIKDYKLRYGNSEFQQKGCNIDLMHNSERMETGVSIDDVKSYFGSDSDSDFDLFKFELDKLEKFQMIGHFGYAYGKNIVRVKDGWDIHLKNDINKLVKAQK